MYEYVDDEALSFSKRGLVRWREKMPPLNQLGVESRRQEAALAGILKAPLQLSSIDTHCQLATIV